MTQNIYLREVWRRMKSTTITNQKETRGSFHRPRSRSRRRRCASTQIMRRRTGHSPCRLFSASPSTRSPTGRALCSSSAVGLSLTMGLMRVVEPCAWCIRERPSWIASYAVRQPRHWLRRGGKSWWRSPAPLHVDSLEGLLYRRIYGSPQLTQVLMTIGITFCVIGITNYFFGPTLKTIPLPAFLSQSVDLGFRSVAARRLFVMACGAVVAVGLWFLIDRPRSESGCGNRRQCVNLRARWASARAWFLFNQFRHRREYRGVLGGRVRCGVPAHRPYYALRYMVTFLVVVSVGGAEEIGSSAP